jgi:two-component system sensor histidine kinase TctE
MIRALRSGRSLTQRLLWVLITTLSAVALALGLGGSLLIHRVVERSFDKLLGASVRAIAETIAPERGDVSLDVPPSALGMLEDDQRDNVYYVVRQANRVLTGYEDLPTVTMAGVPTGQTLFRYANFRSQRVRIASEARRLPRMPDLVVVEVAQTLGERHALEMVMLAALTVLEGLFVAFAAVLVWPALKWSLRPVNRLRDEIDARPAHHANFAPLDLQQTPVELLGLVTGFNHLLSRLENAVARMRQFTSDASHQMRTPLAVLKTHVAVLSNHLPQSSAANSSLADVSGALTRLQLLLTRLTTLARADAAAGGGIKVTRVDLRTVVTQVAGELVPLAAQRNITISVNAESRPAWARAEPVIAAEILTNLVDNAVRYNAMDGSVWISITEDAQFVTVSVEDDGPGVPQPEQARIFERFYRLPRDQAQQGSGLGLPIVRTLAEALRAQVEVLTPPNGRGLRISVRFSAQPEPDRDA